jgi:hypothetical protein
LPVQPEEVDGAVEEFLSGIKADEIHVSEFVRDIAEVSGGIFYIRSE